MKIPLGDDPLQRKWISGVRDLINPIDELKEKFIQERRGKYGTTTKQGMVANQAAQRAKREKDFKENTLSNLLDNDQEMVSAMHKYPKIIERPIVVKGNQAVLGRPPENILELI